jgi:starch synthase
MVQAQFASEKGLSGGGPVRPHPGREAHIVHISSEYWPYIRTGGLGEAVRGMATFQAKEGSRTSVILPLYEPIREGDYGLQPLGDPFSVQLGPRQEEGRIWEATKGSDGPRVLLIENEEYFGRPGVYGEAGEDYPDNHRRFSFFASAAVHTFTRVMEGPILLHMHDWHTALAVVYLRALLGGHPPADEIATVLSIHNGGFQGHFHPDTLPEMGLPMELYHMDVMEWYGRANILKAGLVFTDMATTVSPSHAFELRTEAGGFGLHHTFLGLYDRLVGVLNGIDFGIWDPARDAEIEEPYSLGDLSGKVKCKAALQEEYGLPGDPHRLLIGMVARMVAQKGMDLILGGRSIREADAQFIFLGSGEPRYEEALRNLAEAYPHRIALRTEFTERREHRVISGADALMMPSLYEPCGLTQMRAQRYGTIPLARRVGGLEDTIEDGTTGLLFDEYSPDRLDWTISRAVTRHQNPDAWQYMVEHAMAQDFSWERVVNRYFEIYDRAFEIRAKALTTA